MFCCLQRFRVSDDSFIATGGCSPLPPLPHLFANVFLVDIIPLLVFEISKRNRLDDKAMTGGSPLAYARDLLPAWNP